MKRLFTAACAAAFAFSSLGIAVAQTNNMSGNMSGMPMKPMPRQQTVLCPTHVSVVLNPTAPAAGWKTNNAPVTLSPDAKNLPRVESGTLICYYAMPDGYNAFVYSQPTGSRSCTVRPDNTGFECH